MEQQAVEIRGLEKTFPGFKLGPLDLTVPRGAIYGFIGPNGAGKTTTLDLIMGMGREEAGSIRVFGGHHIHDEVFIKRQVGYASPDTSYNAWGRIERLLAFVRGFYPDWDNAYCDDLLRRFDLKGEERIATLSFGARIKLGLVVALAHRPALLLLDEPLAGLDAIAKRELFTELLAAVQDERRTVLVSSHNLDDIERYADHVGMIQHGRLLVEGPTRDLVERFRMADCSVANSQKLDAVPGVRIVEWREPRYRLLVNMQAEAVPALERLGATDIVLTPCTLEELFVALVKAT